MHNFENAFKGLPPRRYGELDAAAPNKGYCGWGTVILPYLELKNVGRLYQSDYNFYDPANAQAIATPIAVYSCPATQPSRSMTVCDPTQTISGTGSRATTSAPTASARGGSRTRDEHGYSQNTETAMATIAFAPWRKSPTA